MKEKLMEENIKEHKAPKNRGRLWSFLLIFILLGVTAVVLVREFDIGALVSLVKNSPRIGFVYCGAAIMLLYFTGYAVFMRTASKALGFGIGRFRAALYSALDFFYTSATPGGCGSPAALTVTMSGDGAPPASASAAVIMQTIVFRIVLLLLGSVSGALLFTGYFGTDRLFRTVFIIGAGATVFVTFLFVLALFFTGVTKRVGLLFIGIGAKFRFVKDKAATSARFTESLGEYRAAAKTLKSSRGLLGRLLLATLMQRCALFSVPYFTYLSLGGGEKSFIYIFFLQIGVSVAVDSLPIPGGIGLNEYVSFLLYESLYPTSETAAAAMLLNRAIVYYIPLILTGVITVIRSGLTTLFRKRKETT